MKQHNDTIESTIKGYLKSHELSLRSVTAKAGLNYELIRRSINDHTRPLRADEFLMLLEAMGLEVIIEKRREEIPPQ